MNMFSTKTVTSMVSLCVATTCLAGYKAPTPQPPPTPGVKQIQAKIYNSGFVHAHDTYNGMGCGSDGKIYYVLSSEEIEKGAQVYCLDPATQQIKDLGDLTEACGEKNAKAIPQGKSHVNFVEANGKLYFATHVGVYSIVDGMEKLGKARDGYKDYPGGHFLSLDMKTGKYEDLCVAPEKEGILTFNMDTQRGRLFGISWPKGLFFRYDLATKNLKNFGKQCADGEDGVNDTYRVVCRSICINPNDGKAYFTTSEGTILYYDPASDSIKKVEGEDLVKDYFGKYDPKDAGSMGYNWRMTLWHPAHNMIYGVHGNSGYLFSFDPAAQRIELYTRLTSLPSRLSGMNDQFSYGYLGFALGPDNETIHYLTGGPIYVNGKRLAGKTKTAMGEAKGMEDLHLVTYNLKKKKGQYTDHGAVYFPNGERPLYVNSIAVGKDGMVYFLGRINENGKTRCDLIAIPGPLKK